MQWAQLSCVVVGFATLLYTGQSGLDESNAGAKGRKEGYNSRITIRPIISTLSFSNAKYSGRLDCEKFILGCAKAVGVLKKDFKQWGSIDIEISSMLLLDPHVPIEEGGETAFAENVRKWLRQPSADESTSVAQMVIDDLPEIAGNGFDKVVFGKYKSRILLAASLKCRNVVLFVDQLADPKGIQEMVKRVDDLCALAKDASKGEMALLIEPKRSRSAGIATIKTVVDGVRKKHSKRSCGVCLNLSAIADDEGEIWKGELFEYVRVAVVETYRFTDSEGEKEVNRDYARIIDEVLQKTRAGGEGAFGGDLVVRYRGRENYMDGVRKSLGMLSKVRK